MQKPSNLKVWRKDVLGFAGKLYDKEACHIEIFTTQAGLSAFWRDSTSVKQGAGSADFYGDAHFVIPANRDFAVRHPRAAEAGAHRIDFPGKNDFALPLGTAGRNTQALHVCVKLDKGQRIATSHVLKPDGSHEQLGAPVVQENYEYELFQLATALYPDCPSVGLEWLRFGRVLGSDAIMGTNLKASEDGKAVWRPPIQLQRPTRPLCHLVRHCQSGTESDLA